MMTLERPIDKSTQAQMLSERQLEAIKSRAIELWGEKNWLSRLCREYESKNGYKHRSKNSKVRAWFAEPRLNLPSLESFNELLIAVDCEMSAISKVRII
jgi:hypothetical protein